MQNLTPEQIKDIEEREKKAIEILKELELQPAAQIAYDNIGNDGFVTKVFAFLQDTKYRPKQPIKSPFPIKG